ncbi:MAG: Holliday junction branch migration protein RuvA [Lachnospiraceae bacterium]|nr:Holliday junction branch migration protein RuvA [Lachnospiraceae bacterium]
MFAFLEGQFEWYSDGLCVVNCGGVGYEVVITGKDADALPAPGSQVRLYTQLNFNENTGFTVFGFLSPEELKLFKLLTTVNGVGPKAAQAMLDALTTDELRFAILSDDVKTIAKAPGIGSKTAGRIINDLKDKMSLEEAFEERLARVEQDTASAEGLDSAKEDAVMALVSLGYSRTESLQAVKKVKTDENSTADSILKDSLKFLL